VSEDLNYLWWNQDNFTLFTSNIRWEVFNMHSKCICNDFLILENLILFMCKKKVERYACINNHAHTQTQAHIHTCICIQKVYLISPAWGFSRTVVKRRTNPASLDFALLERLIWHIIKSYN
jgi:hypothetical protein